MKVYKIVFSPTGGTERAAEILAKALGSEVETVDLSRPDFEGCVLENDAEAVIAIPSFGGRAPKLAIERLKKVKGSGAKAVAVAVYGNRAQEDTLLEIADAAKECGFEVAAGISAVAEHSIAHQYATGRPDKEDEKQLKEFAEKISEKLNTAWEAPAIPGNRPYKKAGGGMVPSATSACDDCGRCARQCPAEAIDRKNPKKTDKALCIGCMRCVAVCPKGARKINSLMEIAVGAALKKACSERKENELYL